MEHFSFILRGRCNTWSRLMEVRRSLATPWVTWALPAFAWQVQHLEHLSHILRGRTCLRDMFRGAQWLCRFTFRENEYQQALELCRDMRPCLHLQPMFQIVALPTSQLSLPHCRLNDGCPVTPLQDAMVDTQLGMITVGNIDANFIRILVKLSAAKLE